MLFNSLNLIFLNLKKAQVKEHLTLKIENLLKALILFGSVGWMYVVRGITVNSSVICWFGFLFSENRLGINSLNLTCAKRPGKSGKSVNTCIGFVKKPNQIHVWHAHSCMSFMYC